MTTAVSSTSSQAIYDAINKGTGGSTTSAASDRMSETQDRFLKLLTTQLKNQDPLNPMDNAQMTSQMAQISTVDGIERLNATLQTLLSNSADTQTMQAATLVGHGVMVPGSAFDLAGGKAVAGVDLAGAADNVSVTITDANGLAVRTMKLGAQKAGVMAFSWDGRADNGTPAVDGHYKFSVAAVQGTNTVDATALTIGTVSSIERSGKGVNLNVGTLGTFSLSDVREVI